MSNRKIFLFGLLAVWPPVSSLAFEVFSFGQVERLRGSRTFLPQRSAETSNDLCQESNRQHQTRTKRRDSALRAALDRHHLLGIEPVVDTISPMLHQLRARADQRERSVLLVEPLHSRTIEMREL